MTERASAIPGAPQEAESSVVPVSLFMRQGRRMEAEYYLTDGYTLRLKIESAGSEPLERLAMVWQPARLKGVQVTNENGAPFLTATQVFDVRPRPRKWLALDHTPNAADRFVERGWILVTCSGCVGDAIIAYSTLDGSVITHDLLRVVVHENENRGYLYTFLRTSYARRMMRSAKYGKIIKHLEPEHLQQVPVISAGNSIRGNLNGAINLTFKLRDEANDLVSAAELQYEDKIGNVDPTAIEIGFVSSAGDMFQRSRRLDAYSYNPRASAIIASMKRSGFKTESLGSVTEHVWTVPRFKHIYQDEGIPYLDSEDLFKTNPNPRKHIPRGAKRNAESYFVRQGWLLMACSGQLYGLNGNSVIASSLHEKKIVSNHVMRIQPNSRIRVGYLSVAMGHRELGVPLVLRNQYGTSVPEIDASELVNTPIMRLDPNTENSIADKAERAVALCVIADNLENAATAYMEAIIANAIGDGSEDDIDGALADLRAIEAEADPGSVVSGAALEERMKQWLS